jgi:hypothetical protein
MGSRVLSDLQDATVNEEAADTAKAHKLRWRSAIVFGGASLAAIVLGAVVMMQADIPLGIWIRNPIAWIVACALGLLLARFGIVAIAAAPVALIVIGLSLIGPDQEGVRRWLDLGVAQLNAAALVLPAAIAAFTRTPAWLSALCFVLIAGILAWQPDISQLAGFSIAAIILATSRFRIRGLLVSGGLAAAAITVCLLRPDPLAPVEHVEGILQLASSQSSTFAIALAAAIAIAAASPLLLQSTSARWPAFALAGYFAATTFASQLGPYPVPLAGYGLSFVLGWWLGIGALSAASKHA